MVKPGYKQTEIGVIPEEWRVETFGNVGGFYKGGGISMKDVKPTGFPCIMYGDIYVKFDTHFNKCDYHIDFDLAQKSIRAQKGDVFFTASGETAEDIGRCVSYQGDEDIYIGGDIIAVHPFSEYDSLYLAYVQNSNSLKKKKASYAQGHSVVHINSENIKRILFACPPLSEQKRIAEALSDVDELIFSLEKLIEKYKSIKSTCLQQMFPQNGETTPKMRLPGFTGAWEQRKLEECIDRIGTGLNPRDNFKLNTGGSNYYVTIKNFEHGKLYLDDNCDKIDDIALQKIQERSDLKKDDILFTSIGRVGDCYLLDKEPKNWNINESVFTLRPNQKVVAPEYLFQTIHSDIVLNQILSNITGSTFKSIKIGDLKKAIIPVPCKLEQGKIGAFITALDNLITLHQRKLNKAKKIKQSMMQQLLTGKIRLV